VARICLDRGALGLGRRGSADTPLCRCLKQAAKRASGAFLCSDAVQAAGMCLKQVSCFSTAWNRLAETGYAVEHGTVATRAKPGRHLQHSGSRVPRDSILALTSISLPLRGAASPALTPDAMPYELRHRAAHAPLPLLLRRARAYSCGMRHVLARSVRRHPLAAVSRILARWRRRIVSQERWAWPSRVT